MSQHARFARAGAWLAFGGLLFVLGGCSGITYGTGTRAEMQTIDDLTNITALGNKRTQDIDYKPRAGIVVPPTATLPPPEDANTKTADASWPVDKDVIARKVHNDNIAALNEGRVQDTKPGQDPGFRLPKGATNTPTDQKEADKEGFKQLAAAKASKAGAYDANGKPVRQFLTEPPTEYRTADPTAANAEGPAPTKKKWWWPFG